MCEEQPELSAGSTLCRSVHSVAFTFYFCVCVCLCVHARVCVRACVCVCEREYSCMRTSVTILPFLHGPHGNPSLWPSCFWLSFFLLNYRENHPLVFLNSSFFSRIGIYTFIFLCSKDTIICLCAYFNKKKHCLKINLLLFWWDMRHRHIYAQTHTR